jgi:hypothetical protein
MAGPGSELSAPEKVRYDRRIQEKEIAAQRAKKDAAAAKADAAACREQLQEAGGSGAAGAAAGAAGTGGGGAAETKRLRARVRTLEADAAAAAEREHLLEARPSRTRCCTRLRQRSDAASHRNASPHRRGWLQRRRT